jgi:hypothetical protein
MGQAFTGGEPLPTLTWVGRNSGDYVLLPGLEHLLLSVRILRFHCGHCYARAALGRFDPSAIEVIDRIVACRCTAVLFRKDIPSPRSGREWSGFRDQWLKSQVRHRAADADGLS